MMTSRLRLRFLSTAAVAGAIVLASSVATAQEEKPPSAAMEANKDFRLGFGPTILIPRDNGPAGGGMTIDGRYGIKVGPTVLAPGGRLAGYIISARFIATAMPTFRVTLPVGPFAPYVLGGVGGGWLGNPREGGLALLGGGGLMIHFGRVVGIGAELTYQRITGTEFESLAIGPSLYFGG